MNKSDIFKEKIKKHPLHKYFDVNKEQVSDYDDAISYLTKKYEDQYGGNARLYVFVTCALDTENCRKVFDAVRDSIVNSSLSMAGFQ